MILASVRGGSKTYTGQIIAHVDSGINDLARPEGQEVRVRRPGARRPASSTRTRCWRRTASTTRRRSRRRSSPAGTTRSSSPSTTSRSTAARRSATASRGRSPTPGPTVGEHAAGRDDKVKVIAKTAADPERHRQRAQGPGTERGRARFSDGLLEVVEDGRRQEAAHDLYNIDGLATAQDSEYDSVRTQGRRACSALNLEQELVIPALKPQATRCAPAIELGRAARCVRPRPADRGSRSDAGERSVWPVHAADGGPRDVTHREPAQGLPGRRRRRRRHLADRPGRRVPGHHRAERLRQVDAAALHQPPGRADLRPDLAGRRRAHGALAGPAARGAQADRDDLPAVQPGQALQRADQRARRAARLGQSAAEPARAVPAAGLRPRLREPGAGRHPREGAASAPTRSPAASSSGSRSPGR